MDETSGRPWRRVAVRIGITAVAWGGFAFAAHALIHRYLFDIGPIPGAGLAVLAAQALAAATGAVVLLIALRPGHFINLRGVLATAIWVTLIVLGHYLSHLDTPGIRETLAALRDGMGMGALLMSAVTLAILLGLPFVPSVEMGLLMMAVFGPNGAIAAWLATIVGLSMAYGAGMYMPDDWLRRWLETHGLTAVRDGSGRALVTMLRRSRLGRSGGRLGTLLLRHRYLLFAALINMPGNSVLGGGGGIALVSGFARLYRWPLFILTVALASTPIPLLVFFGLISVEDWLARLGG